MSSHQMPRLGLPPNRPAQGYKKIGFGQCGIIFYDPAHDSVFKLARPHFEDGLWNDYLVHVRVRHASEQLDTPCRVPEPLRIIPSGDDSWWNGHQNAFPLEQANSFKLPTSVLISQRIPALPLSTRNVLTDLYCPPSLASGAKSNAANEDCLVRIYLGRRRPADALLPPNFSLRNYNLCVDQMENLHVATSLFAEYMAESLAVMHWSAFVDGYDVEFVLGRESILEGTQVDRRGALESSSVGALLRNDGYSGSDSPNCRIWLLDFNLCTPFAQESVVKFPEQIVSQLVLAFFENDPYYPLPLMEHERDQLLWDLFQDKYLEVSRKVLEGNKNAEKLSELPAKFISECTARERKNLDQGLGHGHRDLKG